MKLLIVGGAGYVGTLIRETLEAEHLCSHFDLNAIPGKARMTVASVTDPEAIQSAVQGMDCVLYMPLGLRRGATNFLNDPQYYFDVHALGFYYFVRAGLYSGVRRFIYVSSLSVYADLRSPKPLCEDDDPDCFDAYGLSKRLGEYIGEAAIQRNPDTCVAAVRLFHPRNETDWPVRRLLSDSVRRYALGPNDTRRLFQALVRFDQPGLHLMQASGDIEDEKFSNNRAYELLGWKPEGR